MSQPRHHQRRTDDPSGIPFPPAFRLPPRTPKEKAAARRIIAAEARRQLGKPYVYGARWQAAPREFDCSSFAQYLYRHAGIVLPRVSIDQAAEGRRVPPGKGALKIGDLIFIKGRTGRYDRRFPQGIGHVIVVTGPDEVIHAKYKRVRGKHGGSVIRQTLSRILKRKDVTVVKRYM
ncbi:MAG TPA: NlpC/P60 family protein [Patescibacteria group bacterium]|nr:NlpC/P60 family protein [Patescibacteria group bacterium]